MECEERTEEGKERKDRAERGDGCINYVKHKPSPPKNEKRLISHFLALTGIFFTPAYFRHGFI